MTKDKKHSALRIRIILGTTALALVPLVILGAVMYDRAVETSANDARLRLELITEHKRRAVDTFLDARLTQLADAAATHSRAYFLRPGALAGVFTLLQAHAGCYTDLGVIDDTGGHLAYTGPSQTILKGNFKNQAWFRQVQAKGLAISDVYPGLRRSPHFIIAVSRREGQKSWILRAAVDSDKFDALVQDDRLGKSGDAFLVNPAGQLQSTPRTGGRLLENAGLGRIGHFPGVRLATLTGRGRTALYGLAWLTNKNWLLAVRLDPREDAARLARTRELLWALIFGAALAVAGGAALLSRPLCGRFCALEEEKNALDAALTESNRMASLGKMAAGVAHEINNPLAVIKEEAGWMHDLLEDEDVKASPNFREFAEAIEKIERHVKRARGVTQRMLGFARRSEPSREPVDVNDLVTQTIGFLQSEARHRSIDIVCELAPDLPRVTSDPAQLQQVLLNIIGNAIDAIGQDGRIRIASEVAGAAREARIVIADDGPGIPKDTLAKIFEPFFTTKKVGEGTGLGLSICAGIVRALGGRIDVTSEEGRGATFSIALPLDAK